MSLRMAAELSVSGLASVARNAAATSLFHRTLAPQTLPT